MNYQRDGDAESSIFGLVACKVAFSYAAEVTKLWSDFSLDLENPAWQPVHCDPRRPAHQETDSVVWDESEIPDEGDGNLKIDRLSLALSSKDMQVPSIWQFTSMHKRTFRNVFVCPSHGLVDDILCYLTLPCGRITYGAGS
ncbi:hypothetical protein M378DRAFT_178429 [Amanita muscaria Koide BX008]|uniref:Uncharacterized protein n=1 Tax=Amanita muscaria (strain Koide BX008) TaxID=946122 RepID=A0A0C2X7I7_AMAMK|nr:hypothetical protein M378DRAFT_178429 [Amanita muscaria Koide BX008]